MLFITSTWKRFVGQTEWINGPGGPIRHKICGAEILTVTQSRTIWEEDDLGPFASHGQEMVSTLYCPTCHGEPTLEKTGTPISRSLLMEVQ